MSAHHASVQTPQLEILYTKDHIRNYEARKEKTREFQTQLLHYFSPRVIIKAIIIIFKNY